MTAAAPTEKTDRYAPARPKIAPFARYKGTSAWRKDRRRVRAYALYMAQLKSKAHQAHA